ncbi:hypothetical protein [Candidatus Chlorohelix sp.]|uniref:hypothetical protein n=1 Tax=Candidatus Chlorohelix sp. TaxID=3139201 RepID=UPI0030508E1D
MAMDEITEDDILLTPETNGATVKPRKNRLKKHSGKLLATSLLATSLLLAACADQDCTYIYKQVNQPTSSGFTGSTNQQPVTNCYSSGSRYYGSSYVYVGSYGSSG